VREVKSTDGWEGGQGAGYSRTTSKNLDVNQKNGRH